MTSVYFSNQKKKRWKTICTPRDPYRCEEYTYIFLVSIVRFPSLFFISFERSFVSSCFEKLWTAHWLNIRVVAGSTFTMVQCVCFWMSSSTQNEIDWISQAIQNVLLTQTTTSASGSFLNTRFKYWERMRHKKIWINIYLNNSYK